MTPDLTCPRSPLPKDPSAVKPTPNYAAALPAVFLIAMLAMSFLV